MDDPGECLAGPTGQCEVAASLVGVLVVSTLWGLWLGTVTAIASGLAFDYFHTPPLGTFTWEDTPLPLFVLVSLLTSWLTLTLRSLAVQAEERRGEADLAAELARLLLSADHLRSALPTASQRLAEALGVPGLSIKQGAVPGEGHKVLPLRDGATPLGGLLVPEGVPEETVKRLSDRVAPALEALLRAALDREASRDELARVATEQAALRRVATLVARGVSAPELFGSVATEIGLILKADCTAIARYEPDRTVVVVGSWSDRGPEFMPSVGSRWPIEEGSVADLVQRTRRTARVMDHDSARGEMSEWIMRQGITSSVGTPIVVEASLWGFIVAFFLCPEPTPDDTCGRMLDFTELVATAVSNAEARDELAASRARVIAAADDTRRRIERDLHDGAQQRLVSVGLELRAAEAGVPPELTGLREQLTHALHGMTGVLEDLQELSRGIHPAILSKGGLGSALKMLSRRAAVPVELSLQSDRRLPERVEVAVYYVVAEALTNVAKHARASVVYVDLSVSDSSVRISVRDDGVGGADPGKGSGLVGLSDRVHALGGTIEVTSPADAGTSLVATVPISPGRPADRGREGGGRSGA
ncbi:sensor histidine kinase [Microtetraspora glauca]|uniref:histidine kinase n=1 Tax=Microtetraspora glauca TaxID=1996 RepID=A0ABV3GHN7_MICGL